MTDTKSVQNAVRCGGGLSYRVNGVDLLENIELELKRGQLHAVIAVSYTHLTLPTIYSV